MRFTSLHGRWVSVHDALADGYFDLLLIDEQHEYKARGSAQGLAAGTLAEACKAVLTLTGTLMGGYSSTLFYLLWRFSPAVREEFGHADEAKWVSRYGIVERISRKTGDHDAYEDGRSSRRKSYRTRVVEKPGVSPAVLFHLIGNTAFLRLADVASGLPKYTEEVRLVGLATSDAPDEPSQAAYYQQLASQLEPAVHEALAKGSKRLLGTYLQSLLAYPDACMKGELVIDPGSGAVIAAVPPLPEANRYPKEQALLDLSRPRSAKAGGCWCTSRTRPVVTSAPGGVRIKLLRIHTPKLGDRGARTEVASATEDLEQLRCRFPTPERVQIVVRSIVALGGIDSAIVEAASELHGSVIAIASHGHSRRHHVFVGSTALGVLGQSPLPVLLVRSAPTETT